MYSSLFSFLGHLLELCFCTQADIWHHLRFPVPSTVPVELVADKCSFHQSIKPERRDEDEHLLALWIWGLGWAGELKVVL